MGARQAQAEEAAAALLRGVDLPGVRASGGTTSATAQVSALRPIDLIRMLMHCLANAAVPSALHAGGKCSTAIAQQSCGALPHMPLAPSCPLPGQHTWLSQPLNQPACHEWLQLAHVKHMCPPACQSCPFPMPMDTSWGGLPEEDGICKLTR